MAMPTFVIHLAQANPESLHGRLRCIRTGEELPFASGPELLDALENLRAAAAGGVRPDPPPGRADAAMEGGPARGP